MSHHGGPSQGSRRLQVITNSFKITGLPKKPYYQYDGELHWHSSPRAPLMIPIAPSRGGVGVCVQYVGTMKLCALVYHVSSCILAFFPAFEDEKMSKGKEPRRRIEVFERLQNHTHPDIFKPKVIYDGDAIAYSSTVLSFGNASTVSRSDGRRTCSVLITLSDSLMSTCWTAPPERAQVKRAVSSGSL